MEARQEPCEVPAVSRKGRRIVPRNERDAGLSDEGNRDNLPANGTMMMLTPTERQYLDLAAQSLAEVKTERELVLWDDCWTSTYEYAHLPQECVRELEAAYRDRETELLGVLV